MVKVYLKLILFSSLMIFPRLTMGADELPVFSLFYSFHGTHVCGVSYSKGESAESVNTYAFLINVPKWVREANGQKIESKVDGSTINFLYLPSSLEVFCRQHGINPEKLKNAEGRAIIDCGPFSDQLDSIDLKLMERIEAYFARWYKKDHWTIHPRPEPKPPAWLNRPLNRKFFYETSSEELK
ncbi:MAG: hypothetical protein AAFY98_06970 [Verrucomicrobiota bacterium]